MPDKKKPVAFRASMVNDGKEPIRFNNESEYTERLEARKKPKQ